jgi:hypothetical protein
MSGVKRRITYERGLLLLKRISGQGWERLVLGFTLR